MALVPTIPIERPPLSLTLPLVLFQFQGLYATASLTSSLFLLQQKAHTFWHELCHGCHQHVRTCVGGDVEHKLPQVMVGEFNAAAVSQSVKEGLYHNCQSLSRSVFRWWRQHPPEFSGRAAKVLTARVGAPLAAYGHFRAV